MMNEAPITTATSALGSIKLDKVVQADGEIPLNAQRSTLNAQSSTLRIALLTGGGDKPYALGMAAALTSVGIHVDFIGSDDLSVPELLCNRRVNFLNLRGDQRADASSFAKARRVLKYYIKLISYAATAQPRLFHLLWNNKFELFDRTVLMLYYRLLGKKIAFTAHNVNAGKRDSNDSFLNRRSLRIQYNLCHHIFVHTEGMKRDLVADFRIPEEKVSVIPFGINNTIPNTSLSSAEAKRNLGINSSHKTLLFFGNIAPYKGLEYLISAFAELLNKDRSYRLVIVGKPKGSEGYWKQIHQGIVRSGIRDRVIERIEYVPDEDTELFFKAADVLILPYTRVFQSGVLFLGYSFGLPAIAADVGSLKEEIIEGVTGFVSGARDSTDLARTIERYFCSELFHNLETRRAEIKAYANERYSWSKVANITTRVYSELLVADHADVLHREGGKAGEAPTAGSVQ
jgi:glycosyltransferase involved in cell wall biosynthesis